MQGSVDCPLRQDEVHNGDIIGNCDVYYCRGVSDDTPIVDLTPDQMGVLLTLQPCTTSYVTDAVLSREFRRTYLLGLQKIDGDFFSQLRMSTPTS